MPRRPPMPMGHGARSAAAMELRRSRYCDGRSCKMSLNSNCDKNTAQVSKSVLFGWFYLRKFAQAVLLMI